MASQYQLTQLSWTGTAASAVTAIITAPSGATSTLQAAGSPGATTWVAWFTPTETGTYQLVWTATRAYGTATTSTTVTVTAEPELPSILTVQDCLDTLKISQSLAGSDPARDADMLAYARAATAAMEALIGPITPRTHVERFPAGPQALLLRHPPASILAVTTIDGRPVTGWEPDMHAWIVTLTSSPTQPVLVRYITGTGQVRPNVRLGIREIFRQVWERSRALGGGGGGSDMVMQGFSVPAAVRELVADDLIGPDIA